MALVVILKRFLWMFLDGLINLIFIVAFIGCIIFIFFPDEAESLSNTLFCLFFFGTIVYNGFVLTWHFDKGIKDKAMIVAKNDTFSLGPFSQYTSFNIRLCRGMIYCSVVTCCTSKRYKFNTSPVIRNGINYYLATNPDFVARIKPWVKIHAFVCPMIFFLNIAISMAYSILQYI